MSVAPCAPIRGSGGRLHTRPRAWAHVWQLHETDVRSGHPEALRLARRACTPRTLPCRRCLSCASLATVSVLLDEGLASTGALPHLALGGPLAHRRTPCVMHPHPVRPTMLAMRHPLVTRAPFLRIAFGAFSPWPLSLARASSFCRPSPPVVGLIWFLCARSSSCRLSSSFVSLPLGVAFPPTSWFPLLHLLLRVASSAWLCLVALVSDR